MILQQDKLLHLTTSFCLTVIIASFLGSILGAIITLVIGVMKEGSDAEFDLKDMLYNVIGILLALYFL